MNKDTYKFIHRELRKAMKRGCYFDDETMYLKYKINCCDAAVQCHWGTGYTICYEYSDVFHKINKYSFDSYCYKRGFKT